MKRLADCNFTEQEILQIFGSKKKYQSDLAWYDKNPAPNTESYFIARLLALRGKREEARKVLESITDDEYRETCLEAYANWDAGFYVDVN